MTDTQTPTDLRAQIIEALNTTPVADIRDEPDGAAQHQARHHARHDQHKFYLFCALCQGEAETLANAVLTAIGDQAVERMADEMWQNARLRSMQIRGGTLDLDITEAREMAAMYVGMARAMLGDAENYTETRVDFTVKVAESPESYVLTVQRAGKLTPHEARQRAEAERDDLRERIAADCARRASFYDHPEIWLPESQEPDAIAARAMQQAWSTAARLIRSGEIPAELILAGESDIETDDSRPVTR